MRRLITAAVALLAACMTQPLTAQARPSDSTQIKFTKIRLDSTALIVLPAIAKQCTFSVQGFFKPACQWAAPLNQRSQRSNDSALVLSRGMTSPKTDTLIRTTVDTVIRHDTVYIVRPDTVKPPIPPVDTVKPPVDTTKPPPLPADTSVHLPTLLTTTVASTPSAGRTLSVASGGNLQAALDSARYGDRILLACGAIYLGNYVLPQKTDAGSGWVTVAPSCVSSLADSEGVRMTPARASALKLPIIKSVSSGAGLSTALYAKRWRISMIEITNDASTNTNTWGLIAIGDAGDLQKTLAQVATDIIIDRCYIHGNATLDARRAISNNGARVGIIDSYISDIHSVFDAQGIGMWNGPGPFKIVNNYIEATSSGIGTGGSDPAIPGLTPSDIEIRRNHIAKPMAWLNGPWLIKTSVEFKQGRRVLVEGNVIENNWPHAQNGFAFVIWSVNQQTTCTWCVTEHVTIQNNLIRNVAGGWTMVATGANGLPQYRAVPMNHVRIANNVVIGLNAINGSSGYGQIFQISDTIQSLAIEHNTAFSPTSSSFQWNSPVPLPNHIIKNNLVGGGQYQIFSSYGQGQIAWDHAGGPGSSFLGNVVALFSGGTMIPGNDGPSQWEWIGLAGGPSAAYSVTATLDDLAILPSSGYSKKGTDGRDPGADIPAVKAATAGVVQTTTSTQRLQIRKP